MSFNDGRLESVYSGLKGGPECTKLTSTARNINKHVEHPTKMNCIPFPSNSRAPCPSFCLRARPCRPHTPIPLTLPERHPSQTLTPGPPPERPHTPMTGIVY